MAEIITIEGHEYKKRSPWGVWGLGLVTIGIYYFVWYYKINDEARRRLGDDSIKPGIAVLAQFVPIANWISLWNTGLRIGRMQEKSGMTISTQPILGVVASFIASLHIVYYQYELNKAWDAARGTTASAPPAQVPPPPPPPPPPP
jgi:hypothetical protein